MLVNMLVCAFIVALIASTNAEEKYFQYGTGSSANCGSEENPCSPTNWDVVDASCAASSTVQQSPISISSTSVERSSSQWGPVPGSIDGGCTGWTQSFTDGAVTLDFADCNNLFVTLELLMGYHLDNITFHTVSEHAIGGGRFDGEVQFNHHGNNGTYLTVSVLLQASNSLAGTDNAFLGRVFDGFRSNSGWHYQPVTVTGSYAFNPYASFTPASPSQYHYTGSSTVPPCTSKVEWYVYEQPISISYSDLTVWRDFVAAASASNYTDVEVLDSDNNNNRPLQPVNEDTVVYYIPGGDVPIIFTLPPLWEPTMAPSQEHNMPRNAEIVGSVAIALSGVLLVVTIALFFVLAKQHTSLVNQEVAADSEQLL